MRVAGLSGGRIGRHPAFPIWRQLSRCAWLGGVRNVDGGLLDNTVLAPWVVLLTGPQPSL